MDPDGAAGQPDAADEQEHHRKGNREQRMGVLQRVERQVPPFRDRMVATAVRQQRVRVLAS